MKSQMKTISLLFIVIMLLVPLTLPCTAYAALSDPKIDMQTFLNTVANIDTSKYNVTTLSDDYQVIDNTGQRQVRYVIENENGTIDATCLYKNETLVSFIMNVPYGVPTFARTPADDLYKIVNATLDNYMNYLGSTRILVFKDLFNIISSTDNAVISSGNLKLTITSSGLTKTFVWAETLEGFQAFELIFYNGYLKTLNDEQAVYAIVNENQTINQNAALEIARSVIQNFSWTQNSNRANVENVTRFTIKEEAIKSTLCLQTRESQILYPLWRIEVPLNQIYFNNNPVDAGSGIVVGIWADNGELSYCHEITYGGVTFAQSTPTIQPTSEPDDSMNMLMAALAVGTVVFVIVLLVTLLIFKRAIRKFALAKNQAQTG